MICEKCGAEVKNAFGHDMDCVLTVSVKPLPDRISIRHDGSTVMLPHHEITEHVYCLACYRAREPGEQRSTILT